MRVAVSRTLENAYWTSVAALLDAAATAGKLLLYSGDCPARGTVAGTGNTLIAEFQLQQPAAASIADGVMTLATIPYATVLSSANHSYAAGVDGDGHWVLHLDTGVAGSGASWIWNAASYTPGGLIVPTTLTLSFPA
jgi:hypothetical protein